MFNWPVQASIFFKPNKNIKGQISILINRLLEEPYVYYYPLILIKVLNKIYSDELYSNIRSLLSDSNNQLHIVSLKVDENGSKIFVEFHVFNHDGFYNEAKNELTDTHRVILEFSKNEFHISPGNENNAFKYASNLLAAALPFKNESRLINTSACLFSMFVSFSVRIDSFISDNKLEPLPKNINEQFSELARDEKLSRISAHHLLSLLVNLKEIRADLLEVVDDIINEIIRVSMAPELDKLSYSLLSFKKSVANKENDPSLPYIEEIESCIVKISCGQLSRTEFLKILKRIEQESKPLKVESKLSNKVRTISRQLVRRPSNAELNPEIPHPFIAVLQIAIENYRCALSSAIKDIISSMFFEVQSAVELDGRKRHLELIKYYSLFEPAHVAVEPCCYFAFIAERLMTQEAFELVFEDEACDVLSLLKTRLILYLMTITYELMKKEPKNKHLLSVEQLLKAKQYLKDQGFPIDLMENEINQAIVSVIFEHNAVDEFNRLQDLIIFSEYAKVRRLDFVRQVIVKMFERAEYDELLNLRILKVDDEVFGVKYSQYGLVQDFCMQYFIQATFRRLEQVSKKIKNGTEDIKRFIDCFYEPYHLLYLLKIRTQTTNLEKKSDVNLNSEESACKILREVCSPVILVMNQLAKIANKKLLEKQIAYGTINHAQVITLLLENMNINTPLLLCAIFSADEINEFKVYLKVLNELVDLTRDNSFLDKHLSVLRSNPNISYDHYIKTHEGELPPFNNHRFTQFDCNVIVLLIEAADVILKNDAQTILSDLLTVIEYVEQYMKSLSSPVIHSKNDFLNVYNRLVTDKETSFGRLNAYSKPKVDLVQPSSGLHVRGFYAPTMERNFKIEVLADASFERLSSQQIKM